MDITCNTLLPLYNRAPCLQRSTAIHLRVLKAVIIGERDFRPVTLYNLPAKALVPHGVAQGDDRRTDMMCRITARKRWGVLDAISCKGEDTCFHPHTVIASPVYPDRRHNGLCPSVCFGVRKSQRTIRRSFSRSEEIPCPAESGSFAAPATQACAIDKQQT